MLVAMLVCSAIGLIFAAVSAYDFIVHLDRQLHAITCSLVPGLGALDASGESGCYAVMMSPYSAVFKDLTWGGIPIALPAFSVFAYLVFLSVGLLLKKPDDPDKETLYAIAAAALPVLASVIYFVISVAFVGSLCKSCIGIYLASIGVLVFAILAHLKARRRTDLERALDRPQELPWGRYGAYVAEGVAFVVLPLILYLTIKPAYTDEMARCGELIHPEDKYGVHVTAHASTGGIPAVELLDPLCPACSVLRDRLRSSGLIDRLNLKAVMFPLDKTCNWMVTETLHPGACTVSEAILCAGDNGAVILDWALDNHEQIRKIAADPKQLEHQIRKLFPFVDRCLGRPKVKARINKSLRWIVSNAVPVSTPQLFVRGKRVCDEDTDIGLEFSLTRLLARQGVKP